MKALDKKNLYHDVGGCGHCGGEMLLAGQEYKTPFSSCMHNSISGAGTLRYHWMYVLYKTIKAVLR